ncbi:MAG: DinB family protein [Chloroflexota bacterium]|nr:DinB family protein [Chloroflexota bacterium]
MATPDDVAGIKDKLNVERAKLIASFENLPRETMLHPYEGGWSIKDVLAHLAMAESVNVRFARMMVVKDAPLQLREFAAEYPDFPGAFELDKFNAWMTERWRAKSLEQVLAAMAQTRGETLAWLETLSPAQLERSGEHAVWGTQSVRGMLRILVIHDKFHRGDIEKRKNFGG